MLRFCSAKRLGTPAYLLCIRSHYATSECVEFLREPEASGHGMTIAGNDTQQRRTMFAIADLPKRMPIHCVLMTESFPLCKQCLDSRIKIGSGTDAESTDTFD